MCPTHQPEQLRNSLTKTVPKARIIPNKVVMQTKGDQYERWKQATSKELQAFLKTALKEPTAETKARYFAKKQKVVMQLPIFTVKPMTAGKRALGLQGDEYEKARICLQGQNHEGFQIHNSTNNADAHLLRLFLSVYASSKNVFASFDVSNASLNAELSEEVTILTQPAPELVQFGLVKPGTLYQCTKACYGLREAPKLWEESRDKTLTAFTLTIDGDTYSQRDPDKFYNHCSRNYFTFGKEAIPISLDVNLVMWQPFAFLALTLNLVNKRARGLYINRVTHMPSSKRCLGTI